MIDIVIGYPILAALIYVVVRFICNVLFEIEFDKYEQIFLQKTKIGQKLSGIEGEKYFKYYLLVLLIAVLYDNITTCDNDPLGINKCERGIFPLEYDSYRGRK